MISGITARRNSDFDFKLVITKVIFYGLWYNCMQDSVLQVYYLNLGIPN